MIGSELSPNRSVAPRLGLLLLTGLLLGPQGLHVLTADRLAIVAPINTLALVILGAMSVRRGRRAAAELVPLGIAGLLLAATWHDTVDFAALGSRLIRATEVIAAASAIAIAGRLFLATTTSATERRVFVLGTILVLSGTADFAAAPAVPVGVLTGVIWHFRKWSDGAIWQDLTHLSQPLGAALLLLTGADLQLTPAAVAVCVACVAGSALTTLLMGSDVVPGLLMLACAIDVSRTLAPELTPLASGAALSLVLVQFYFAGRARLPEGSDQAEVVA